MKKFKDLKLGDRIYFSHADEIISHPVTSIIKQDKYYAITARHQVNVFNINDCKVGKAHVSLSEAKKTQIEEIKIMLESIQTDIKKHQEKINEYQEKIINYTITILESK